ncbi:unnamed protein product [Angiostrongylus costaricensis]|uniref:Prefoldin subunit 3 n=1 Tax=Angiostrongylus costaricensis TaxID=334426 RepID=A0A158PMB3_ANGCS|nr:unnamed protein product [Angiostrongylus costaricensis]
MSPTDVVLWWNVFMKSSAWHVALTNAERLFFITNFRMVEKLPDFKNSLALIDILIRKKVSGRNVNENGEPFDTTFLVAEEVFARATVKKPETVSIWLGANVMVEYELDKARELLEKNRSSVQKVVDELTAELAYVKDQITTTEVNIAHVHNYGVNKRKRKTAA